MVGNLVKKLIKTTVGDSPQKDLSYVKVNMSCFELHLHSFSFVGSLYGGHDIHGSGFDVQDVCNSSKGSISLLNILQKKRLIAYHSHLNQNQWIWNDFIAGNKINYIFSLLQSKNHEKTFFTQFSYFFFMAFSETVIERRTL